MAISMNNIQTAFVRTLNALVGKDACGSRQLFTSPVIKAREGGTRPDYPYVMVDKGAYSPYGYDGKYAEYYDELDQLTQHRNYKIRVPLVVHGNHENDVQAIAQTIRDTLFREYGKQKLWEEFEGGLLDITSPSFSSSFLNTDYEEVSRIVVSMSVTDVFVEDDPTCPSTGSIESISVDGEVESSENDPSPLNINTQAP